MALAGKLLETVGSGWASRVFYSDDGSTAIEVALKMAFRKFMHDRGLDTEAGPIQLQVILYTFRLMSMLLPRVSIRAIISRYCTESETCIMPVNDYCPVCFQVLGLQNAYHGDTLGAMDCVAPSVYNGRLQAPWYRGRGVFLNPPYVSMVEGR